MGNKLYVANLVFHATEADIQDFFSQVGTVLEVKLILDKVTGKSRGFGFVTMGSDAEGERAITELNGSQYEGRSIAVTEARPREDRPAGGQPGGSGSRPPFRAPAGGGGGGGGSATGGGGPRPPYQGGPRKTSWTDGSARARQDRKPRGPRPMRDEFEE